MSIIGLSTIPAASSTAFGFSLISADTDSDHGMVRGCGRFFVQAMRPALERVRFLGHQVKGERCSI